MISDIRYWEKKASEGHYAIPHFNVWNAEMLMGVIDAAEELRAPIIISFGTGFTGNTSFEDYCYIMYQINFEEGQCNEIVVDQCDIKVIFEEECQVEKLVINIRENFEKVPYVVAYESVGDIEINIGSCVGIMVIEDIIRRVKASRYSINIDRNSLIELIKLRGYDNDIDNRVQKEVDYLKSNLEDMYKYSMNELSVEIKDGLF